MISQGFWIKCIFFPKKHSLYSGVFATASCYNARKKRLLCKSRVYLALLQRSLKKYGLNKEDFFIARIGARNNTIGDDAALKEGLLYSKDAFFENVHFKRQWMNCYQIAQKAMMVNISDAVAMNAVAKYALLAVAVPKTLSRIQMRQLSQGFLDTAARYGIEIIGGDTIANDKIDITVTIISHSDNPLWRRGIKNGDLIAYTGKLGRAKRHLQRLMAGELLHFQSRFHTLRLRSDFIRYSRYYLHAGMDISDGLFSDLQKLSKINRCGFAFNKRIPKALGCSGEEYEMLIACPPRHKTALMRRAKKTRTPLSFVAKARRGTFVNRCKSHHF